MKKTTIGIVIMLCLGICLKTAAQQKKTNEKMFTLEISNLNGIDTLFLTSETDNSGSYNIPLKNGRGKITIPLKSAEPGLYNLGNLFKYGIQVSCFVEPGKAYFSDLSDGLRGTPNNNAIAGYIKEKNRISHSIDPENNWWKIQMKGAKGEKTTEEDNKIMAGLQSEFETAFTREKKEADFAAHIGKPGEAYFLFDLVRGTGLSDEETIKVLNQASEKSRNLPLFRNIKEQIATRTATVSGKTYLDFSAAELADPTKKAALSKILANKEYTVLDFWASWCKPCVAALPEIKQLHEKYGDRVNFVNIATYDKAVEKLKQLSKEHRLSWTNLYDTDGAVGKKYAVSALPTTILIDKNGTILLRTSDLEQLKKELESALN